MDTPGVAGGLHAKFAGRIGAQHIALEYAVFDDIARPGSDTVIVERRAAERLLEVGLFVDADVRSEHLFAEVV